MSCEGSLPLASLFNTPLKVENSICSGLCRFQQREPGYKLVLAYTSTSTQASVLVASAEWLWGSLLTDSKTPRQVVQKCSGTGESAIFRCRSCLFYAQNLEDFTKHLSGEEHAQIESIRRRAEYTRENSPKSNV